jgi:hypothetical protein
MVCHGVSGAGRVRPRERAAVSGAAIRRSYQAWQLYGADIAASRRAVRLGSVIGPWGACRGCSILGCVPQCASSGIPMLGAAMAPTLLAVTAHP